MKPELLMICLLRSSAAALATHHRGVGGGGAAGAGAAGAAGAGFGAAGGRGGGLGGGGGGPASSRLLRRMATIGRDGGGGGDYLATLTSSSPAAAATPVPIASPGGGGGRIAFRLARRSDVAGIQECNLATLPENYNSNFYVNHVRAWPELSLVAEHVPEGWEEEEDDEEEGGGMWGGGGGVDEDNDYDRYRDDYEYGGRSSSTRITPLGEYWKREARRRMQRRRSNGVDDSRPRKEIVGYVLGKVEERFPPSLVNVDDDEEETLLRYLNPNDGRVRFPSPRDQQQQRRHGHRDPSPQPQQPRERHGHVTSLAVCSHARRLGIASSLLRQLHYHLHECHGAGSVGLHVRISNEAAVRLYCTEGYGVADIMPLYYGDGEDAYFMRKDLCGGIASEEEERQSSSRQPLQGQQWRRGERERDEWLNRDAARGGSFFEGRKSMRELLSEEKRAAGGGGGGDGGNASSSGNHPSQLLPGKFQRSFRSFLNGGGGDRTTASTQRSPRPWEAGPDSLRLPRYVTVMRASSSSSLEGAGGRAPPPAVEMTTARGLGLNLADSATDAAGESSNDDEEEGAVSLDSRVATGSV